MPKKVIAVVDDLFFASRIRGTAEQVGASVRFARDIDSVIDSAKRELPSLIIVDLQTQKCDPLELARRLNSDPELGSVQLLGFFSHVQVELQRAAEVAGFHRVMPRSLFTRSLPEILSEPAVN
jgi:PleD family two-component response regulator